MKKLVLSILFVLQAFLGFSQQGTGIAGKVVDAKTQMPLQNISAIIAETNFTQLTNEKGEFKFTNLPVGSKVLTIKGEGYKEQSFPIEILAKQILEIGTIVLEEDVTVEQQLSLVTITENDLGDDNSGSETTSGLLQSSRDAFQQAAAFNWGQARFRIRGLDNENAVTMINGVAMNKIYDGRPQWGNWGGLNDATRNQEFTMGSAPSDYTFGGILGTQEINTRASNYRKGSRISFSGTNTNYNWRVMGTHASGLDNNGWAFVVSAGRRWAQEAYFDGTDYKANSLFASVEKRFGKKHALNFTSIFAENSRGKSSPNTEEVNNLKGFKYNSYWGWQDGKKRNSRYKDIQEPIMILSHYWKITDKTNLTTNVAYQTGLIGNSRLDYQSANSPDPTYYKYLPSYYNNLGLSTNAEDAKAKFIADGQIDWNGMYYANKFSSSYPGRALYALYADRTDDTQITANSYLFSTISDNVSLNAGGSFRKLKSHNYQKMIDLLGAEYFSDVDLFYQGDAAQSDLNNTNRKIYVGDEYGYNYNLNAIVFDAFTQFKFSYKKADFYLAQTFSKSEYQREGLYKNGIYPTNSFGKSAKQSFENFGFKGGLTYKLTSQHLFDFNGAYLTKAPNLRNTFANARINNNITPDLASERIASIDASYIIRTPKFKSRLTAFASKIQNATQLSFFYAEGVGEDTDTDQDAFISELLTGVDKKNFGLELGLEYQITSTIKVTGAASYGQYLYDNNPNLKINDDAKATLTNTQPVVDFGQAYLKNYRQPGMPQTAASIGLEYRDPHYWWISANYNYLADSYISISNITRTDNFVTDSDGLGFNGMTSESLAKLLQQEKFNDFYLLNASGGKSWRLKDGTTLGLFATVNNILDQVYKTGGFEQSRKATYPDAVADNANGTPSFGSKYFYGYGRTYFVNLFVNF